MIVAKAAQHTLSAWRAQRSDSLPSPFRCEDGQSLAHQRWLLQQIVAGKVEGEKAHRWLGYAQGYLVALDEISLEACKLANLRA